MVEGKKRRVGEQLLAPYKGADACPPCDPNNFQGMSPGTGHPAEEQENGPWEEVLAVAETCTAALPSWGLAGSDNSSTNGTATERERALSGRCRGDIRTSHPVGASGPLRESGRTKRDPAEGMSGFGLSEPNLSGKPFSSAAPVIRSLLIENSKVINHGLHGKTQPKGDIFPLPTSSEFLAGVVGLQNEALDLLVNICLGLNSYAGVSVEGEKKVSPVQKDLLRELRSIVNSVCGWSECFGEISWQEFFKWRSLDYVGDEVATARITSWSNLRSAIPTEVGGVELADVVSEGCRHYVLNFEDYLVSQDSRVYTRPPRVMVSDQDWDELCDGLISTGICGVMPEHELFQVEGKPLLNGLFGVSKGESVEGHEIHRLIMNLVPLNQICRPIQGDVATLPAWSSASPLYLMPTDQLLISSEDVRCFFYIFSVPHCWQRFLGFNKPVSGRFHVGKPGRHYLVAKVLPMGFKNSVSLAQNVHRNIVKGARAKVEGRLGGHQELRKDRAFPNTEVMHRVYLDNFDELEKVDKRMAEVIVGTPSPSILALRSEYEHWGVPRHPKKAVQRATLAEVQGAIVDGERGCAYPKPEKILKYSQLALLTVRTGRCSQKEMQVIAGGLVYLATFKRALMGSLNAIWQFIEEFNKYPPVVRLEIPRVVKLEIVRLLAMMPLAQLDFRLEPHDQVTASDASTTGGGVTVSRGLTNVGQMAASCSVRGDVASVDDMTQILTIGLFDGVGALRVAADAAGLPVAGHVSVEVNAAASRVLESRFPSSILVSDVEAVDLTMVKEWAGKFTQVGLIILGGDPHAKASVG